MEFSKTAVVSLLIGIVVLLASWYAWFAQLDTYMMITTALVGGVLWFGIALVVLGLLMIFA
ncbi:MAG: hypothetical protein V1881_03315 [Candidatus Micrarchaeota archaeon]